MSVTDRSAVKAYYASFGEREWERLERPADGAVEFAVTMAALERHLPTGAKVLDIGGGPGRYAIALAQQGHRVTLADLSPELLRIAVQRIDRAPVDDRLIEVVEADACDLSRWGSGWFDAALSLGPFYHLTEEQERRAAAEELARVVRSGGPVFVAAMPRLNFLQRAIALPDERHHIFDVSWMRRLLEDGVFENEIPGRFSLGYGVQAGEIESLFSDAGFVLVDVISAESISVGIESEIGKVIEVGGAVAERVLRLMVELAGEPKALGSARHLLYVGRRR